MRDYSIYSFLFNVMTVNIIIGIFLALLRDERLLIFIINFSLRVLGISCKMIIVMIVGVGVTYWLRSRIDAIILGIEAFSKIELLKLGIVMMIFITLLKLGIVMIFITLYREVRERLLP